jgi:ribonuclease HII
MKTIALKDGPDLSFEMEYSGPVCGIDEAGRGPLAGPVTAACVHIPAAALGLPFWAQVTDSKKLTEARREVLYEHIVTHTVYGIADASAAEIDSLNIHHATLLAMKRAHAQMRRDFSTLAPVAALVDGKFGPALDCAVKTVVKGDSKSLSIAAASILAKVTRDRIMAALHAEYPYYGWDSNAGYGTPVHMTGLKIHGVTPHHRRSFAPVREAA